MQSDADSHLFGQILSWMAANLKLTKVEEKRWFRQVMRRTKADFG